MEFKFFADQSIQALSIPDLSEISLDKSAQAITLPEKFPASLRILRNIKNLAGSQPPAVCIHLLYLSVVLYLRVAGCG
jgi:hypothetical protein